MRLRIDIPTHVSTVCCQGNAYVMNQYVLMIDAGLLHPARYEHKRALFHSVHKGIQWMVSNRLQIDRR